MEVGDFLDQYDFYNKSLEDAVKMGYVFEDYKDCFRSLQRGDWVYFENLMSMEEDCKYLKDLIDNMKDFYVNMIRCKCYMRILSTLHRFFIF